jgi:hypothetical protein
LGKTHLYTGIFHFRKLHHNKLKNLPMIETAMGGGGGGVVDSVSDPDPGSGAFLTPGSGIRNRFFPDPGSRIPDPKAIFLRA